MMWRNEKPTIYIYSEGPKQYCLGTKAEQTRGQANKTDIAMGDTDWNGEIPWKSNRGIDYARPIKVRSPFSATFDETDFLRRSFALARESMGFIPLSDFLREYRI